MPSENEEIFGHSSQPRPDVQAAADIAFTRCYDRLVQIVRYMIGTYPDIRGRHEPESIVHDVWFDLRTALKSIELDSERVYPLLAQKARLALLDIVKKERRRLDILSLVPEPADSEAGPLDFGPSSGSSCDPGRLEIWTRFHKAVGELPVELREPFELFFYADIQPSFAQIGGLLGIHPRQAARLVTKAKITLADRVRGLEELLI